MSTNEQSIKHQIKAFDAASPSDAEEAQVNPDPRVDQFLELMRAKVAALDVEQREKWEANVPKVSRRKTAAPQVTPDWYETGPIKAAKAGISQIKKSSTQHPYPGRRTNKPKTP